MFFLVISAFIVYHKKPDFENRIDFDKKTRHPAKTAVQ